VAPEQGERRVVRDRRLLEVDQRLEQPELGRELAPMAAGLMRLECRKSADGQGALAARNMLGAGEACVEVPWFWSDQYELSLQMAGVPERGARTVERDMGAEARLSSHLDRGGRLVGVSGVGPAALGRELRIGRIMIERGLSPDPAALADPAIRLKALLR
jgi:3-phenylpropionate/trans-cinnamate dioxygenase ferredoxin reductase subunit